MSIGQQEKDTSVCLRLKDEREKMRITQQDVAAELDVSLKTVTRWEKSIPIPSDKLGVLVRLGFDAYYILTGKRSPAAPELTTRESCMLEKYRAMADEDKAVVQRVTHALAQPAKQGDESA